MLPRALARPQEIGRRFADFRVKSARQRFSSAIFAIEYIVKQLLQELQIGRCQTSSGRPLRPSLPVASSLLIQVSES